MLYYESEIVNFKAFSRNRRRHCWRPLHNFQALSTCNLRNFDNFCENCKKPVPKKIYFCVNCRRRWCSQECKDKQYSEHLKTCEFVPKYKRNGFMG